MGRRPPPKVRHRRTACLQSADRHLSRSPARSVTLFASGRAKSAPSLLRRRACSIAACPPPSSCSSVAGCGQRPRRLRSTMQASARRCPPQGEAARLRKGRPPFRSVLLHSAPGSNSASSAAASAAPLRATALHSARSLLRLIAWRSRAAAHERYCKLARLLLRRRSSTHLFFCALRLLAAARIATNRQQGCLSGRLKQRPRPAPQRRGYTPLLRRQAWRSTAMAPAALCLLCRLPLRHSRSAHCSFCALRLPGSFTFSGWLRTAPATPSRHFSDKYPALSTPGKALRKPHNAA